MWKCRSVGEESRNAGAQGGKIVGMRCAGAEKMLILKNGRFLRKKIGKCGCFYVKFLVCMLLLGAEICFYGEKCSKMSIFGLKTAEI